MAALNDRRRRRLAEELEENGFLLDGADPTKDVLLEEVDRALHPPVHEHRIPSTGTILEPAFAPEAWTAGTNLDITRGPLRDLSLDAARRFTDGFSSWLLRRGCGENEWIIFDRPAGSERDLVVLVAAFGATIIQRHPSGSVRIAGGFGVWRWDGIRWHHEPPVQDWIDSLASGAHDGDLEVVESLLRFAVHDLGSLGIGALLVYRAGPEPGPPVEDQLSAPPPLRIRAAPHLAPLRHALSQLDGAAMFDAGGTLRQLGVRLLPSRDSIELVEGLRGTRHTAGRRYSFDDPAATVIVVSEDGPVTVLRRGKVVDRSTARSPATARGPKIS
jgi:sensor domain DACNK-containing protein/DisA checkpoint controller-like protein